MTYAEFESLILLSDRMIASCVPRKSEYWRGYNSGIKFHFQNGQQESLPIKISSLRSPVETEAAMFMLTLVGIVMVAMG